MAKLLGRVIVVLTCLTGPAWAALIAGLGSSARSDQLLAFI
jgi:hypothetical protein